MGKEKVKKKISLITFISIFFATFFILIYMHIMLTHYLAERDSYLRSPIAEETIEENEINIEQYEKYKEFYDQYDVEGMKWFIKDLSESKDGIGAYTSSAKVYDDDYLVIVDGELYYIPNKNQKAVYEKYDPENIDSSGRVLVDEIDRKINYIIVPFEDPSYVMAIDEQGYVWTNIGKMYRYGDGKVTTDYLSRFEVFEFNHSIKDINDYWIDTKESHKVIDVCVVYEPIDAYTEIYFMLEDGSLIDSKGHPFADLNEDFYSAYENEAVLDDFDTVLVKSLYYQGKSYIEVNVDDGTYINPGTYFFDGVYEKIKKVAVSTQEGIVHDIFILTENGNVYSYAGGYMYSSDPIYLLYKVADNIVDIEDTDKGIVATNNKGKVQNISDILYADGE